MNKPSNLHWLHFISVNISLREVPRADRFMKIDINHPQCTWILPVKWRLEISSRLGGVRQQRICTRPPGQAGPGANPLLPNSSETAWNFETPFYRKEDGSMRMVYVYFHKLISTLWPFFNFYYFRGTRFEPLFHFYYFRGTRFEPLFHSQFFLVGGLAATAAVAEEAGALPVSDIPWGPLNIDRAA